MGDQKGPPLLDIGGSQTQDANLVSITLLGFHRNTPLSERLTFTNAIELRSSSNRRPVETNSLPDMGLVGRDHRPFEYVLRDGMAWGCGPN